MSVYAIGIFEKPSDLLSLADTQDVLAWFAAQVRAGEEPTFDDVLKRIDAAHPDDVEMRIVRTASGRLSVAFASSEFTGSSALDDIGEVITSTRRGAA